MGRDSASRRRVCGGLVQQRHGFSEWQAPPPGSNRRHNETDCGYYVTAKTEDAVSATHLMSGSFPVPQQEKGTFGQSNIWYAK